MKIHEPVGVIGMACPDAYPLLGFVSLFAPAVVRGNTMVIIPSQNYPLSALDLYQVMLTTLTMYCLHRHQYYKTYDVRSFIGEYLNILNIGQNLDSIGIFKNIKF